MLDLNALTLPALFDSLTQGGALERLLNAAFEEDVGLIGDVTTRSIIPVGRDGAGAIAVRQGVGGVVAGLAVLPRICERFAQPGAYTILIEDGKTCAAGDRLATLQMPLREMLAMERIVLNIIGRLSGIATLTRQYVDAVAGSKTVICDTRKTTPGMRALEKYAVRCGGGTLHRLGLYDAALYKDNHLAGIAPDDLAETLSHAIANARAKHDLSFVEVEVDTLEQLRQVLSIVPGMVDMVLLDNMPPRELSEAVALRNQLAPRIKLEASGGVNINTIRAIAESGVDRIAVGALTHGASWLDVGLDIERHQGIEASRHQGNEASRDRGIKGSTDERNRLP